MCSETKANPPLKSVKNAKGKGRDCLYVLVLFIRFFVFVITFLAFCPFKHCSKIKKRDSLISSMAI
ncbi:hypothetical protein EJD97_019113, partial [Solanum chilense]